MILSPAKPAPLNGAGGDFTPSVQSSPTEAFETLTDCETPPGCTTPTQPALPPDSTAMSPSSTPLGRNQVTRSRSSSISQTSSASRHFAHYREPTVLDKPDAVDEIREALAREDYKLLSHLTQDHGLPPSLRPVVWPLLLSRHPLVKSAEEKLSTAEQLIDDQLPVKRIRGDIRRLQRKCSMSPLEESEVFEATMSFLRRYGSVIPYESPMLWIAEYLLNGERPRPSERSSEVGSLLNSPNLDMGSPEFAVMSPNSATLSPSILSGSPSLASPPSASLGALSLGAPAQPFVPTMSRASVSSNDSDNSLVSFTGVPLSSLRDTLCHVMLLMHELPEQYSEFVTLLRTYLPNVGDHFSREGILGASGGDDWLAWWLRWLGIRAFPPEVLARLWDTYFSLHLSGSALMKQHLFNCIVLIRGNRAMLAELDQSECRQLLLHLPSCKDVEAVLVEGKQLAKTELTKS